MNPRKQPPWKRPRPASKPRVSLDDEGRAEARARAEAAGRRYPNLVDNLWALARMRKRLEA